VDSPPGRTTLHREPMTEAEWLISDNPAYLMRVLCPDEVTAH
jgi:hypothetical protein